MPTRALANLCLLLLLLTAAAATAQDAARRVQIDEAEAARALDRCKAAWSDAETWRSRAAAIREHIRGTLGLPRDSSEQRVAPPVVIHSRRELAGYTIENIAIEASPGFFIAGNLYRPLERVGPFAAVLCPHGHFQPADGDGGRFRADMQVRCATLARMGAIAIAWDMVGWGETTPQLEHDHPDSLMLQTWASMRILDYLASRDDVDAARIGITGASGGGTQTFLLAALDNRIAVSVPVVMVSAHFFGGCMCESGLPIHRDGAAIDTNNAEIAALAAPRPQLVISCGADWTKNTPDVELPYMLSVYQALGAADRIANVHLADEGHDYGPSKRAAMLRFMAKHLELDLAAVTNLDGTIDESDIEIQPRQALLAFDEAHPRPGPASGSREEIMAALRDPSFEGDAP